MKNTKTRVLSLLLAGGMLLTGTTPMAYATQAEAAFPYMEADAPDDLPVLRTGEYGDYILSCYATLSMGASGCTYGGYVKGNAQTTKILARLYLLEHRSTGWEAIEIKETTTTSSTHVCRMSDFSSDLVSGMEYMTRYRAWVYAGDDYDYQAKYSPSYYAP